MTERIRLDKWLWAARFYKTRSLAQTMVEGGKVHYDGHRVKASKEVHPGARVTLTQGYDRREVIVLALSERRGSAKDAALLYEETPESIAARTLAAERRALAAQLDPSPLRRPDKRERREIIRINQQPD
jgi:ribosome-associated heat shock protein Hsp15